MIADFTVAGESHTDHKDQWKDCENHNTENRKCQQGPVQSLINERFQILFDGVDMFPFLCTALYLVSALHIDTPDHKEENRNKNRCHSVEQEQNCHIAAGIFINTLGLVPHLFLRPAAQGDEMIDIVDTAFDYKQNIRNFYCQKQNTLYNLFMSQISQSHDKHGKLRERIALCDGFRHRIGSLKLFGAFFQ